MGSLGRCNGGRGGKFPGVFVDSRCSGVCGRGQGSLRAEKVAENKREERTKRAWVSTLSMVVVGTMVTGYGTNKSSKRATRGGFGANLPDMDQNYRV